MEPNTQANQISTNTKDESQLDLKLIYVNKFPVWSTFYKYLPLILISLSIALKIFLSFVSDFRNHDANIITIFKFNISLVFIVITAFLISVFVSENFQVPVLTGSYHDYLTLRNNIQ